MEKITNFFKKRKTFKEIAENFYDADGDWVRERRLTGRAAGEILCRHKQYLINKHAIPIIGKVRIKKIKSEHLKRVRDKLYGESRISADSTNRVLYEINQILLHYKREGVIGSVPEVQKIAKQHDNRKGILTLEEAEKLFAEDKWKDERVRIMNIFASCTGMRCGEIQALRVGDIVRGESCGIVVVNKNWSQKAKKTVNRTKTGKDRTITIPLRVVREIDFLISKNPYIEKLGGKAFIFFSEYSDASPIDNNTVLLSLYAALNKTIGKEERKRRNITFHSWRYFLNSALVNARIPIPKIQATTGHLTEAMTQHYYALMSGDMADILAEQERIAKIAT